MTTIIRQGWSTLRFIGVYLVANMQAALEYRIAFWTSIITMIANDSLWLFFWWTFFRTFPLTNGWQITDIVILWSVSACGFGLCTAIFGNVQSIAALVMNGGLDAYLGMPRNILLHVCVGRTSPSAWGDILFGFGAYLVLVHPDIWHLILYIVLVLMVTLVLTAFVVILGSLAFFLGNTEGLTQQMFGALISFSTYPMDIFHGAVRLLLFTVVPAGFISYVPLQLLHQFRLPLFAAMIGATALSVLIAFGVFHLGLRRYESGNLLGMQS